MFDLSRFNAGSGVIGGKRLVGAAIVVLGFACFNAVAADAGMDPLKWPEGCANAAPSAEDAKGVRMAPLTLDQMDEEQRKAAALIASGPRGCIFGPFALLVRSPELLNRTQMLGAYIRFSAAVPFKLREMAMLITGRAYRNHYIWYIHQPIALKSGVSPEIVKALAAGVKPAVMEEDEADVYNFMTELSRRHAVSDANYEKIKKRFGEKGVLDLVGLHGYYGLLALEMNVARTAVPEGVVIPFAAVK